MQIRFLLMISNAKLSRLARDGMDVPLIRFPFRKDQFKIGGR
jgi:hypothetical protein